jgi:hypothetical protein
VAPFQGCSVIQAYDPQGWAGTLLRFAANWESVYSPQADFMEGMVRVDWAFVIWK